MPLLQNISSTDWSLSISGANALVQGLTAIAQNIQIILNTQKGSDPLRPEFGTEILEYIDKPNSVAIPNMIREIISSVNRWESRVTIISIVPSFEVENSHKIKFTINWKTSTASGQNIVVYG